MIRFEEFIFCSQKVLFLLLKIYDSTNRKLSFARYVLYWFEWILVNISISPFLSSIFKRHLTSLFLLCTNTVPWNLLSIIFIFDQFFYFSCFNIRPTKKIGLYSSTRNFTEFFRKLWSKDDESESCEDLNDEYIFHNGCLSTCFNVYWKSCSIEVYFN